MRDNKKTAPLPHENVPEFLAALEFTQGTTGFRSELIEKDYFCSLVLSAIFENEAHDLVRSPLLSPAPRTQRNIMASSNMPRCCQRMLAASKLRLGSGRIYLKRQFKLMPQHFYRIRSLGVVDPEQSQRFIPASVIQLVAAADRIP
jgi:hypothetical protein